MRGGTIAHSPKRDRFATSALESAGGVRFPMILTIGCTMSERPIIVLLDDLEHVARDSADWSALERRADLRFFHEPLRGAALIDALRPAHAVVLMRDRTHFSAQIIRDLPQLKYVLFTGNRNESIDLSALRDRGIPVSCTRFGPARISACEQAWALILAAAKRLPQSSSARARGAGANPAPFRPCCTASASAWWVWVTSAHAWMRWRRGSAWMWSPGART